MAKKAKKAAKKASKKSVKKLARKASKAPAKKVAKKAAKKVIAKKAVKKAASPAAKPAATPSKVPAVGSPAPDFNLPSSVGRNISLADYAGKTVVLYFYPRADTPGCTIEACGFRDAIASYGKLSVDVLGVSPDPVEDVSKFAQKFNLTFPLLADTDHSICEKFGVWVQKSMYGKTYMGAARTTFVIKDGRIAHVFEKVNPQGHEAEVLKVVESA
jgi:peroxiredoxin Q/BCP